MEQYVIQKEQRVSERRFGIKGSAMQWLTESGVRVFVYEFEVYSTLKRCLFHMESVNDRASYDDMKVF
jgi:hypothetical protein